MPDDPPEDLPGFLLALTVQGLLNARDHMHADPVARTIELRDTIMTWADHYHGITVDVDEASRAAVVLEPVIGALGQAFQAMRAARAD